MINDLINISKEAGEVLKNYFYLPTEYENKESQNSKSFDLITKADLESEKLIIEFIKKNYPSHSILSEESIKEDSNSDNLWVIDPLDGTNNFAHKIPQFSVSIGFYQKSIAKFAVVYNPITKELFTAEKNKGSYLNEKRINVSQTSDISHAMIGTGFYYDRGQMMEDTLDTIKTLFYKNIHGIRRMGAASLDLCYIACGRFDAYFEYKLSPWDFAAGSLIVEEAGGRVTNAENKALPIKTSSIFASNNKLHHKIADHISWVKID